MEVRRETPLGDTQDPFAAPEARLQRLLRWVRRNGLIPILLLAAAVRFYDLTAEAISGDEGSSVLLARYSLSDIWRHAAFDVHPPLYFMLLRGWIGLFGDSIFALRCFSALPGIATVGLGMWLVDRLATRRAAIIAGVLLALLPTAIRYSQDVRMYALLGVLLLAANLALVYWVRRPQRQRYLVVYALLMGAALYTHYFAVFAALSHWLYLGLIRLMPGFRLRHIQQPGWWLANLGIAVMFLPWLPSLLGLLQHMDELKAGGDVGWEDPVTLASLPSMVWTWLTQDDGEQWSWPVFVGMPLAMLVLVGVALMRDRTVNHGSVLLALYTLVPLLLVFAVSFITPVFIERYMMVYVLGLPMLAALAIDRLYGNARVLALAVLVAWVGIELIGVNNNATVDRDDQFNVPVEFVNQHFVSGDRIVTSDMLFYLSYVYYNRTDAKIRLYTPPATDGRSTRPNEYGFGTLVSDDVYLDRLADLADGSDRIWLIGSLDDPDEYPPLPAEWQRTRDVHGGDIYARLYVRASPVKPGQ